ncbi:MAG: glycoside hydrolase family 16 protein [Ruminococcaceae bacterium]|nr:glycoside hydrolase family 16 protein [Oscillospiraceae bacterium]MBQ6872852.1 glycoside hydrolase family 16 protein [Clostridia bacterium]
MMVKIIRALVAILMMLSPSLPHQLSLPAIPKGQDLNLDSRFELVWSDEFDGTELDRTKWQYPWWETERKGGYWHEDMVDVKDGNLVITTAYMSEPLDNYYDEIWGDRIDFDEYKEGWYTGCITGINTVEHLYGYFECRAILPKSTGMWSAFWMMNDKVENVDGSGKDGTEVDIFESMYYKDVSWGAGDAVVSGIHYDGYGADHKGDSIGKWFANNPYEEYNTYGLEWNENEYIFYINGVETGRLSTGGVSQNPEYLLLSCEVAGENGVANADRHGTGKISMKPGDTAEFIVDYVRVYQYK